MPGTNAANVAVGKPDLALSGGMLVAPIGTERPSSVSGPYDEAYKSAGYISDDGVTESSERSTEEIRAWGGEKVRTVQTEHGSTINVTVIESRNAEALKLAFGPENVDTSTAGEIVVRRNSKTFPHQQFLFVMLDGEDSRILDVPNGQVTEVGDVVYTDGESISYELTISCDPDENRDTIVERIAVDEDAEGEG